MFAEVKSLVSIMMILTSSTDQPTSEKDDQREGGCSKNCHGSNYAMLDSIRLDTDCLCCNIKNVLRKWRFSELKRSEVDIQGMLYEGVCEH